MTDQAKPPAPSYSHAVLARKASMLDELQRVLTRRRRRRAALRVTIGAALPVAAGALILFALPSPAGSGSHVPADIAREAIPATRPPTMQHARFEIVRDNPDRLRPMIATGVGARPTVEIIDDDGLLSLLAETGRSYGLIREGGRAIVAPNAPLVTGPDGPGGEAPAEDHRHIDPSSRSPGAGPTGRSAAV